MIQAPRFGPKHATLLIVLAVLLLPGCGPAGGATPTATVVPVSASCGHGTIIGTPSPGATPTETAGTATDQPDAPDAEFPQDEVPDGTWSGPIVASTTGHVVTGSGSVYSAGGGSLDVVIRNHKVISGTATFNATSSGTVVTPQGGTGTIHGALAMTGGVVTGEANALQVSGTATESGSILVTVHGTSFTDPIRGSAPFTATLTVTKVKCDKVVATFIPDLNSKTGGHAVFTGTAEWHGERQG